MSNTRIALLETWLPRPFAPARLLILGCGPIADPTSDCLAQLLALSAAGHDCTILDPDSDLIARGREAAMLAGSKAHFVDHAIDPEMMERMGGFDVALLINDTDIPLAVLAAVQARCPTLFLAVGPKQNALAKALKNSGHHARVDCLGLLPGHHGPRLLFRSAAKPRASGMEIQALTPDAMAGLRDMLAKTKPFYAKENDHFICRVLPVTLEGEPGGPPQRAAVKYVQAKSRMARLLLYREHEFLCALNSPLFPQPLGVGLDEQGYILALPWLDGPNLQQALASKALPNRKGLREQLLQAQAALREAGIRHRDLRSTNVMITPQGPRILDFGWACWADEIGCPAPPQLAAPDDDAAFAALLASIGE
ncbi:phosphotransferase [Ferrovibrio sp.]|uniref:protein kinase domain-containing protein n=1 Tax=Ferrovibrio sp. TaxID=1917215 RepID=UPI0025BF9339|nr:phosphotransferase [Ferrovibrio sp.]MBX3453128.1 phosphotransferase [Ferrovibrio sp.]